MRRAINIGFIVFMGLILVGAAAAQAQPAAASAVTTQVVTGEVVKVEGSSLVVKLAGGEMKTFKVPPTRTFEIDGVEVGVGDLKPGTTLTATVKTTTTPVTVRTRKSITGKVWYVAPPTVILTLANGENRQFTVRDGDKVEFTVEGQPATVFDLKTGMAVSAVKIVEEPDTEITTDTKVVGQAPKPAAPEPPAAAPASAPPAEAAPAAPEPQGSNMLLWGSLLLLAVVLAVILYRRSSAK